MSFLAQTLREISADYHQSAVRETNPIRKREFEDKRDRYHDAALEWEIKIYPVMDQSEILGLQQLGPARLRLSPHVPNSGFDSRDGGQVSNRSLEANHERS